MGAFVLVCILLAVILLWVYRGVVEAAGWRGGLMMTIVCVAFALYVTT